MTYSNLYLLHTGGRNSALWYLLTVLHYDDFQQPHLSSWFHTHSCSSWMSVFRLMPRLLVVSLSKWADIHIGSIVNNMKKKVSLRHSPIKESYEPYLLHRKYFHFNCIFSSWMTHFFSFLFWIWIYHEEDQEADKIHWDPTSFVVIVPNGISVVVWFYVSHKINTGCLIHFEFSLGETLRLVLYLLQWKREFHCQVLYSMKPIFIQAPWCNW